jgi:hypothetical protein
LRAASNDPFSGPDNADGVGVQNVGTYESFDVALCPRKLYCILQIVDVRK